MKQNILTVACLLLSIFCKAQIVTQTTSPSTIGNMVPGYAQVTTINTKTINYTPSTPPAEPTPVDGDTTTEDIKQYDYADVLAVNIGRSNGNITNTSAGKV